MRFAKLLAVPLILAACAAGAQQAQKRPPALFGLEFGMTVSEIRNLQIPLEGDGDGDYEVPSGKLPRNMPDTDLYVLTIQNGQLSEIAWGSTPDKSRAALLERFSDVETAMISRFGEPDNSTAGEPKACSASDKAFISCLQTEKANFVDQWSVPEGSMNVTLSLEVDEKGAGTVWISAREAKSGASNPEQVARRATRILRIQQMRNAL